MFQQVSAYENGAAVAGRAFIEPFKY